jgi:ubiquinone/menaquinone biosynthesis C-methylase UbiE
MGANYQDQNAVASATDACVDAGIRVLQLFQDGTEAEHVRHILTLMDPPAGSIVVDVGCGVGEVARLMFESRPDLTFLLLNLSAHQLAMCPKQMARIESDMHSMPLTAGCADVVMVNYTLGYADLDLFLGEAYRVLKPGGVLFIYDLTCAAHDIKTQWLMVEKFGYQVHDLPTLHEQTARAGFVPSMNTVLTQATSRHLQPLLDEEYIGTLAALVGRAYPIAIRMTKGFA